MFNSPEYKQGQFEFVYIENLVPQDHLLRKIKNYIDFSFIHEKVRHLYCQDNGRPCIDPVVLFKMLFIGYLYGIRSERQIVREVEVNIAYRWFLGLSLTDKVPHHSTISQNRRRKFNNTDIFQEIFDEIVLQAIQKGLIEGKELFTDSTFLKANANKNKFNRKKIKKSTLKYIQQLDQAVKEDRKKHDKKPLKEKEPVEKTSETRISTTDPESGFMVRDGKPRGFYYLDHVTVDGKLNLITDVHVTPGNVHDSVPYIDRLDRQIKRFGFEVEAVALDAGYLTAPICHELHERDIFSVIAHRRYRPNKEFFHKWQYKYYPEFGCYICPAGQKLNYRTTNREGYREYVSKPEICANCTHLPRCTHSKNHTKVITRHVWEEDKEWVRQNRLSERGKALYKRRKETIERSFADAKELHGLRYARYRGRAKVTEQCLLIAACMNMKKIANYLWKNRFPPLPTLLHYVMGLLISKKIRLAFIS